MYKIIISSLITFTLTTALLQAETYSFTGVQTSLSSYGDATAPSIGLKYGKQIDKWRTALSINYAQHGDSKLTTFLVQSDKGIFENILDNPQYQPYIGFTAGMVAYTKKESDSGFAFGLNGGVTYILNDDIDLDLGYRIMNTSVDGVDNLHNLTLSIHYFY